MGIFAKLNVLSSLLNRTPRQAQPNAASKSDRQDNLPQEYCFPSHFIHTNDPLTLANWGLLNRGYADEAFIKESIAKIRNYTMVTHDGLLATYDLASHMARTGVPGAFIETGVHRGGSAAMMAIAAQRAGVHRRLELFDSFEGIPHPTADEYEDWMADQWGVPKDEADGKLVGAGRIATEQKYAEQVLIDIVGYPKELVNFHVGWFQDTVPVAQATIGDIAILRLDGDLYESTLVCLKHLYPLVVKGGAIIVDDYAFKGCRQACEEYFIEMNIKPYMNHIDHLARYFFKTE